MACETAINKPVHVVDIDRKILSASWAEPLIASGSLTVWELEEPIDKTNFGSRMSSLTKTMTTKGPAVQPRGWINFGEYFNAHEDPHWKAANTVVIDSLTLLNEHLKTFIMHGAEKSKFTFDQWSALKIGWMDTISALRDLHREHNKDLILTVHERDKGQPGERTTGVKTEASFSPQSGTTYQQVYQGTQDVKVWASIDGAFGDLIGAQCDEYYYLYVIMDDDKPVWKCRVHPDGKRSLRTSFIHSEAVHKPDFKEIWR